MGELSNWQGGSQQPLAPPARTGRTSAEDAAVREIDRLNRRFFPDDPIDAESAVFGLGPTAGPERTAAELAARLGRLEDLPSWMNAKQFADAAVEYTTNNSDQPAGALRDRASQWLMHPDRYDYMQRGPGRAVDLLQGLREDPVRAGYYFNRSKGAQTTREGYTAPNYQRYAGFENAAGELVGSPLSGIGRYLQWQGVFPSRLKHGAAGATPEQAYGWANAFDIASQRFRQGEVPILDIPERLPGEDNTDVAVRYFEREAPVNRDIAALRTSSPEDFGRNLLGGRATPALGYAADVVASAADATAPMNLLGGLAAAPVKATARAAANAAARTAGVSRSAAQRMMGRASYVFPDEGALAQGARVAQYRGVPAAAYADALRRPAVAGLAREFAGSTAVNEGIPELAVEGGLAAALPQQDRTWGEFFFGRATPESDEDFAKRQAEWRDNAERAAVRMENLSNGEDQNGIWNEFYKAQAARRQKEAATERLRNGQDFYGP